MTNPSHSDANAQPIPEEHSEHIDGHEEEKPEPAHIDIALPEKPDLSAKQQAADAHSMLDNLLLAQLAASRKSTSQEPEREQQPPAKQLSSTTISRVLDPEPTHTRPARLQAMIDAFERWKPYIFTGLRWLLVILMVYALFWILRQAGGALIPFIIGLILAYLMLPLVKLLDRSMPRWLAILIVYLIFTSVVGILVAYIAPILGDQIGQLITNIPSAAEIQEMGGDLLQYYRSTLPENIRIQLEAGLDSALNTFKANLTSYARSVGEFALNQVLQLANLLGFIVGLLIIPIWLFFILNDADEGHKSFNRMIHPRAREDFWNVWNIIDHVLSSYVRGQLILGLVVGIFVALGLLLLRAFNFNIPYIVLLSMIAAVTELIPIIGPVIGAVPAILLGFTISPAAGIAAILLYVIIQQLENNLLVPRIVGESVGIHPAVLTVALIVMGQAFGLIGVILSAPLTAIARDLFVYTYRRLEGQEPHAACVNLRA